MLKLSLVGPVVQGLFRPSTISFKRWRLGRRMSEITAPEINIQVDPSNVHKGLQTLADLVKNGFHHETVQAPTVESLSFPSPSVDRVTRYSMQVAEDPNYQDHRVPQLSLEAWVLPPALPQWPTMAGDAKQLDIFGKSVLFRRVDNASLGRERESMRILKKSLPVIWIGLPGIGKSSTSSVMLVKAIQQMIDFHENGPSNTNFQQVLYRLRRNLFRFKWNSARSEIDVEYVTPIERERLELIDRDKIAATNTVMIVEMMEKENDPDEIGLYTGSCRQAFQKTFKSFYKGQRDFFLCDPPTHTEARLMYATLCAMDSKNIPSHIDTMTKFNAKLDDIGPVPRYLFTSKSGLRQYETDRISALTTGAFADISQVSVSNVGNHLKYLMAPHIRPGVKVPRTGGEYEEEAAEYLSSLSDDGREAALSNRANDIYEFRALSTKCELLLASKVSTNRELEFLREFGKPFELLETTIKHAGPLSDMVPAGLSNVAEQSRIWNWLWYEDPGPVALNKTHLLDKTQIVKQLPYLRPCTKGIVRFPGQFLQMKVWEMEEGKLYQSIDHNLAVVEWWMVFHESRTILGHQVTMSKMGQHKFDTSTIDKALHHLHMLGNGPGRDYTMVIIGVNDLSLEHPTGMSFVHAVANATIANETKAYDNIVLKIKSKGGKNEVGESEVGDEALTWLDRYYNPNSYNRGNTTNKDRTSNKLRMITRGLKEWQRYLQDKRLEGSKGLWKNADRVKTYMTRVKVFSLPSFELPDTTPPNTTNANGSAA